MAQTAMMAIDWVGVSTISVSLLFCFDAASQDCQKGHCDEKGRKDKVGWPEDHQTDDAGNKGQKGRQTIVCSFHLLNEDDDEECCQGKVDACGIEGDEGANEGTGNAQYHPVQDGHEGGQHIGPFFVDILRKIMGTVQGIVFIRQGIDEEIFPKPEGTEFLNEGQPVEDMTAVQEQCHNGYCCQGNPSGKERYHQILQGARHNEEAAGTCPEKIVSGILHQHTIGQTYGDEADEDRETMLHSIAKGFCHKINPFCLFGAHLVDTVFIGMDVDGLIC